MATFRTFEEIEAWQKARELVGAVYSATRNGAFAKDYGLGNQIRRAAVSVLSNLAEGYERDGRVNSCSSCPLRKARLAK